MADQLDMEFNELLGSISETEKVSEESAAHLGRMLQGFHLQSDPNDQEPYLEIYYSAVERDSISELARVAEALLRRWLGGRWKPRLKQKAHYNLLSLCREIHDSRRLGEPIWELYRRRQEGLIAGEYDVTTPVALVRVLLDAMVRNQPEGTEPRTLWRDLLEGRSDGNLDAGPLDGFVGLLYLPHEGPDEYRVDLLAESLRELFWLDEESMFVGALAVMRRASPFWAEMVDLEAKEKIRNQFLNLIDVRRASVISPALDQLKARSSYDVAQKIEAKWEHVKVRFRARLIELLGPNAFPTKIQIHGSYVELINGTFYEREESPSRTILYALRAIDGTRRPNPSSPDQTPSSDIKVGSPIEPVIDLADLYAYT